MLQGCVHAFVYLLTEVQRRCTAEFALRYRMQTLQLAAQCSSAGACQAHQACSAAYMYQQLTQDVLHPSVSYRCCVVV